MAQCRWHREVARHRRRPNAAPSFGRCSAPVVLNTLGMIRPLFVLYVGAPSNAQLSETKCIQSNYEGVSLLKPCKTRSIAPMIVGVTIGTCKMAKIVAATPSETSANASDIHRCGAVLESTILE